MVCQAHTACDLHLSAQSINAKLCMWPVWRPLWMVAPTAAAPPRSPRAAGFKLEAPPDLEPHIAEALSARRCLPLLAALVHVPAMHAMPLAANAQYGGATSSMGIQVPCHAICSTSSGHACMSSCFLW